MVTDNLGARDAAEGIEMERISREFVERRAQKISRVATSFMQPQGVLPWRGTEAEAKALAQKLTLVEAEKERRHREAVEYMNRECAKLLGGAQ